MARQPLAMGPVDLESLIERQSPKFFTIFPHSPNTGVRHSDWLTLSSPCKFLVVRKASAKKLVREDGRRPDLRFVC